jgi:predicted outer membrane repeat protein
MSFFSWLASAIRNRQSAIGSGLRKPKAGSRKPPRYRPQLEALEDRWLPSTLTVTNNLDGPAGSLRADIVAAQSGDTIVFSPSLNGQTIALTSGVLDINKNLTVQGPGAGQLAVSGNNSSTVFKVEANTQVLLSGLTIRNGSALNSIGGGILNYGTLTVSACTVSNNGAYSGGGIYNATSLTVSNSTVSANSAEVYGGGIYSDYKTTLTITASVVQQNSAIYGGGIWNDGTATVSGSTLSGNSAFGGDFATGNGGAIFNEGTMSILASTVTGNSSGGEGAGIYNQNGYLTIGNKSLVCNNFEYPGYGSFENDLYNDLYGIVKISGGSKVCVSNVK